MNWGMLGAQLEAVSCGDVLYYCLWEQSSVLCVHGDRAPAERLLCAGRASPSPAQLLAFAPGPKFPGMGGVGGRG